MTQSWLPEVTFQVKAYSIHSVEMTNLELDNDEFVVYPVADRDEDVVYAYHAINDK